MWPAWLLFILLFNSNQKDWAQLVHDMIPFLPGHWSPIAL